MNALFDHVVILGSKGGPAIRPGSSMPTSNLLVLDGRAIIVDCGLGVTRGLVDQGVELKDIELIFITHLHSDHYLELGPLLHTAWTAGLQSPVDVYGPAGLIDYWTAFLDAMQADIALRIEDEGRPDLATLVNVLVIDAGPVLARDGLTVNALRVEHPPLLDCFALSFKSEDAHVVFSGDTAPLAALAAFARDADVLIHEAMLEAALPALVKRVGNGSDKLMHHLRRSHSLAHDAARIASAAGVPMLILSHLIPADDPDYDESHWREAAAAFSGELVVARDGLRIDLPPHR